MVDFRNNIIIIGCGAIGHCVLDLLIKYTHVNPKQLMIIDKQDKRHEIKQAVEKGVRCYQDEIKQDNFAPFLSKYLKPGDICIDLANEVGTFDILSWCMQHKVMFLNTNLNIWRHQIPLYDTYKKIKELVTQWPTGSTSAILSHGANPGLVSSFAKKALLDLAAYTLQKNLFDKKNIPSLEHALNNNDFPQLSQQLDIKTIHISEKDSQESSRPKKIGEFLNTWSVVEFINECVAHAEFPWGTHEKIVPPKSTLRNHIIFIDERAFTIKLVSWLPHEEIIGILPPHDENFTIADFLTIKHNNGQRAYRPTVNFVYTPCLYAQESLKEFISSPYTLPVSVPQRIMKEEIISGYDNMGILLLGNKHTSWWTGSMLSIEQSSDILPGHNATIMQVAAGVLAGLHELIHHPQKGMRFPEELNHHEILKTAFPFLGTFISQPTPWNNQDNYQFIDFMIT